MAAQGWPCPTTISTSTSERSCRLALCPGWGEFKDDGGQYLHPLDDSKLAWGSEETESWTGMATLTGMRSRVQPSEVGFHGYCCFNMGYALCGSNFCVSGKHFLRALGSILQLPRGLESTKLFLTGKGSHRRWLEKGDSLRNHVGNTVAFYQVGFNKLGEGLCMPAVSPSGSRW